MKAVVSLFVLVLLVLVLPFGFLSPIPTDQYSNLFESETGRTCEELEENHICEDIATARRNYSPPHHVLTGQQNFSQEYLTASFNSLLIITLSALRR